MSRPAPPPPAPRRRADWQRQWQLYALFAPGAAVLLVFSYLPMYGVSIAFKDFRMDLGIFGSPWIGFEHFGRLFSGHEFPAALRNTVVISLLHLSINFWAPIVLALLLNELRIRWFGRLVQTVTYIPHFFSWVIMGGILLLFLGSEGPVNLLLKASGLAPIEFLTHDGWFVTTLIVSSIWHGVGFGAVIYLAALSGIPQELYEAARVDGASRWQQVWHITLPSLAPTIIVLFILALGGFLNAGFDQIYNLYNPLVYDVADIIDTYVLRRLMAMDYELAAAAGLFKSVVSLVLIMGANALARRISGGEQGVW